MGEEIRDQRWERGREKVAWIPSREPVRLETYWHTSALLAASSEPN